jgi:hypothetical protein
MKVDLPFPFAISDVHGERRQPATAGARKCAAPTPGDSFFGQKHSSAIFREIFEPLREVIAKREPYIDSPRIGLEALIQEREDLTPREPFPVPMERLCAHRQQDVFMGSI